MTGANKACRRRHGLVTHPVFDATTHLHLPPPTRNCRSVAGRASVGLASTAPCSEYCPPYSSYNQLPSTSLPTYSTCYVHTPTHNSLLLASRAGTFWKLFVVVARIAPPPSVLLLQSHRRRLQPPSPLHPLASTVTVCSSQTAVNYLRPILPPAVSIDAVPLASGSTCNPGTRHCPLYMSDANLTRSICLLSLVRLIPPHCTWLHRAPSSTPLKSREETVQG